MEAYQAIVQTLSKEFEGFTLHKIPRGENTSADALASLASTSAPGQRRIIPVDSIDSPSIEVPGEVQHVSMRNETDEPVTHPANSEPGTSSAPPPAIDDPVSPNIDMVEGEPEPAAEGTTDDWQADIRAYIKDGVLPADRWAARRLRARSAHYVLLVDVLYRRSASGTLLRCVNRAESEAIMAETHEGAGGNHSGGRSLSIKVQRQGFFWPTLVADCVSYVSKCDKCQRHGPTIHCPTELLQSSTPPYPFMRWGMDIVGPLPKSKQKRFLLVMTDYFTKWVEAEAYANIKDSDVQKFIWKYIICRHGLPHEITTDNGSQFISAKIEAFCAKWRIRLSHSTPRYPQGNGQAEATNKTIIDGLKKRLDDKKGRWAEELDGVLWSYRTTPRRSTGQTPFSLSHGIEAMSPAEVTIPGLRRSLLPDHPDLNSALIYSHLDGTEELRDQALLRVQNYQQLAAQHYNKRVRGRFFFEGDLVLRKVFENTMELNAGKLGANWEGPYQISKVVRPGVYELMTMDGTPVPRSWNSLNLKKYCC